MPDYLLDACALLAFFNGEKGAEVIRELFEQADRKEITLKMHTANLIEVYYDRIRVVGSDSADAMMSEIYNSFPITFIETLSPSIVQKAAHLKALGKMSFADTILVATAHCTGSTIVSCDHVELDTVERQENIPFLWIRT